MGRRKWMTFVKESAVWMVVWIAGCVVFDAWLQLHGAWMMLGGVITYEACKLTQDWMRSTQSQPACRPRTPQRSSDMENAPSNNEASSGTSALDDGLAVQVDSLYVSVRGSEGIRFIEGWSTGNMTEPGVQIDTVWYAESRRAFGGCIDRAEATQIRDWLNSCIAKWEKERVTAT